MATKLAKIIADFRTSLATKILVGGTSGSLQAATDDDGVALPTGTYYFTIDGDNSQKEHIQATLTGTALTAIQSVSRQGVLTSGMVRQHRVGAIVILSDFAHILMMNNLLAGTDNFNAAVPLGYDGTASITTANQFATKAYVDGVAVAGAPNASTTVKGIVQEATSAQINAGTAAGSTGAQLYMNPSQFAASAIGLAAVGNNLDIAVGTGNKFVTQTGLQHSAEAYALDSSVSANTITVTLSPVPTSYTAGMTIRVKVANAVTAAALINVNALGNKTIKKYVAGAIADLAANDIIANQMVTLTYDSGLGFMILQSPSANTPSIQGAFASGTASYDLTATLGAQSFAHGLGRIPKYIRVTAMAKLSSSGTSAAIHGVSIGTYDGTNNRAVVEGYDTNGGSLTHGIVTTIIRLDTGSASGNDVLTGGNMQTAVATFDATNITLTFTKTGSPIGTGYILWEAFA